MSLYKPKALYAASERQYTATGGEVLVLSGDIYEWGDTSRVLRKIINCVCLWNAIMCRCV